MDGNQAGDAAPFFELATDKVTGAFWRDEHRIDARRRLDLAKMHVEAVRGHQDCALFQIRADRSPIDVPLHFVGQQDVDDVRLPRRVLSGYWLKAMLDRQLIIRAAGALTDDYVDSAIAEVLGLSVSLAAIAEDGDGL